VFTHCYTIFACAKFVLNAEIMVNFRILIADDDEDDSFILTEAFKKFGRHDIRYVKDGQQLLDYLDQQVRSSGEFPDLILLDINMPKTNGIQALGFIRSSKDFAHIPILMYSTSTDREQIQKCRKLGSNGFISKAWSNDEVLSSVRNINHFLKELKDDPFKQFFHSVNL
jgi:CheY-like chemotaxis protein